MKREIIKQYILNEFHAEANPPVMYFPQTNIIIIKDENSLEMSS